MFEQKTGYCTVPVAKIEGKNGFATQYLMRACFEKFWFFGINFFVGNMTHCLNWENKFALSTCFCRGQKLQIEACPCTNTFRLL